MARRTNARIAAALAVMTVLGAVAMMSPAGADSQGIGHDWTKHYRKKLKRISNAVSGFDNASTIPDSTAVSFEQLDVPKGRYAINASLTVDTVAVNGETVCQLIAGGDFDEKRESNHSDLQSLALQVVHQFDGPGTIYLRCGDQDAANATIGRFIKITAIEVPKLTNVAI